MSKENLTIDPKTETNAYILGTDNEELHRLGFQHQVWAETMYNAWEFAGFTRGQTLLDLGSGPGFASRELAYIAGPEGKVIAVDRSSRYLEFLESESQAHGLNIQTINTDFSELELPHGSLDGAYCRWALAWVEDADSIVKKVVSALRPGGRFVVHEYIDWSRVGTEPRTDAIAHALKVIHESYDDAGGDINIGRKVPAILEHYGMKVDRIKPLERLARPGTMVWNWPKTFLHLYLPRMVEAGKLSDRLMKTALSDWERLEKLPGAFCQTPPMIEVIGTKL